MCVSYIFLFQLNSPWDFFSYFYSDGDQVNYVFIIFNYSVIWYVTFLIPYTFTCLVEHDLHLHYWQYDIFETRIGSKWVPYTFLVKRPKRNLNKKSLVFFSEINYETSNHFIYIFMSCSSYNAAVTMLFQDFEYRCCWRDCIGFYLQPYM